MEIIIASPIAASEAATVIIMIAKIWPVAEAKYAEKAIKLIVAELSISSIDMRITIAFFLVKTPTAPMIKSIALKKRYQFSGINLKLL